MRVLLVTATRLGDAVLSTALPEWLRARDPDARFTIACGPVPAGLWARLPGLERVITVEKRRFDAHWPALWTSCARRRWDLAIDLRGSALTLLLRAKRRLIMRGGRRPGHRLGHLAGVLGVDAGALRPTVWTAPVDHARVAAFLPPGARPLVLGPTANWSGKIWPAERFVAVARALQPGRPVVIVAGPGDSERSCAAPVMAALPGAIDACGRLSLPELGALFERAALFVGNDSGLMHLAAAAGAPTIGLFGPSRADEYAPVGPWARAVVAPGPVGAAPMAALTVEATVAASRDLLRLADVA